MMKALNRSKEVCSKISGQPKKILWFDLYHNSHGLRNKANLVNFKKCDCQCDIDFYIINDNDTDQSYGPFDADAVLIQLIRVNALQQPPLRGKNQIFVFAEREAAPLQKINSTLFSNVFNWSMTFHRDSDIFYPYGRIIPKKESETGSRKDYSKIFRQKRKGVIWFVSHCPTKSKREQYVEELRKYIPVDIYGDCGNFTCPKHGKESRKCLPKLMKKYMFRLAFENTYHPHYVTEKLFDWFEENIVLVVLGSANYSQIAPKGTYIDVSNFNTAQDLAEYLKELMNDENKYTEYLKRKANYTSETLQDSSQQAYCQLCAMLYTPEYYQNVYANLSKWWFS